jgi:RING finger protein 170
MEGVGDEVLYFGMATVLCGVMLYYALLYMFSLLSPPGSQGTDSASPAQGRTRSSNYDCAICLGEATLALETNCGHVYCGNCILEVWRRSNALQATTCPYCRQRITIILPYFSQEERDSADVAEIETRSGLLTEVHTYNRRYSGEPRTLLEMIRDLPVLLRHLVHYLFSGDGLHLAFQLRVAILAAVWLLYLLSPLDLIPEAVFGLVGLLDDLVIFLLAMYLTFFFRQIMANMGEAAMPAGVNQ